MTAANEVATKEKSIFGINRDESVSTSANVHYGQPLRKPLDSNEIRLAIKKLKNNRVPGLDKIPNGLLKWAINNDQLKRTMAKAIYKQFQYNQPIKDISLATIIPINKKRHKPTIYSICPIQLLTKIHKFVSTIVLGK